MSHSVVPPFPRALRRRIFSALLAGSAIAAAPASPLQPQTASIEVDAGIAEGPISPLLYGQFAEFMFEGIKGGLHAELIRNRSFEEPPNAIGLPRYWERYPDDRNDDYAISFHWDQELAYPMQAPSEGLIGGHSLRVQLRPGVIARHGVHQARVPIMSGLDYRGYLWIKTDSFKGDVRLALEADVTGGRIYDEAHIANVGGDPTPLAATRRRQGFGEVSPQLAQGIRGERRRTSRRAEASGEGGWKQYAFTLRPAASDALARFTILFTGQGTVWVDQVSLMPGDAVDGVRADVLDRVKGLAPAFIRWPGGNVAQDYHWQWGVGPRDRRPTWINLSWKNEPEPGDFGTDEFIRFARNAGAEPSITVNVEGRGATSAEAAAWVEYCNGPATSTYGAMRAGNGHPEPYRVKYWEIGNEIWGDWVRGHSDAATYSRNLARYVAAMRAVDPAIQVIAVGDNDMVWNRTVLQLAGEHLDYLAVHHYYSQRDMDADLRNLMARPLHYERWYGQMEAALRDLAPARRPRLAINEWGLDLPEAQQYSILAALYGARLMNVFERRGDLVAMSAVSDLVNGWPGGLIQASRHGVFVTPIYLVNSLYAAHLGATRLSATIDGPTFSSTREGSQIPVLDVSASRSADGHRIFIKAVNTDLERPMKTRISVRGANLSSDAVVKHVVADSLAAVNGFATPDAVRTTGGPIRAGNSFSLELPRHSVSVITLTIAR